MIDFEVRDLGRMSYEAALEIQLVVLEGVLAGGRSTLLFVEHDPVLTLGANFHETNLLYPMAEYERRGIAITRTDRGGDVTFHGPGQLVIYPIFNLAEVGKDLHRWLRDLEETMLLTLSEYGLNGRRFPPHTGVWIDDGKIAAIGIKVRRWVSMHGIALNCNNDLEPFGLIVPCGISGYRVASLSDELGREVSPSDAKPVVERCFRQVFG